MIVSDLPKNYVHNISYSVDDIVKARQKSRLAEDTSNLESEVEMPGQRRQRKRYSADSKNVLLTNVER